jgi:hypothetical protein
VIRPRLTSPLLSPTGYSTVKIQMATTVPFGRRAEAGLGQDSPLMARPCASKVGLEKEYLAFSSITSPLIHPSAISVLKTFDLESHRDVLTSLGLKQAGDVILDARAHIAEHGFRPEK